MKILYKQIKTMYISKNNVYTNENNVLNDPMMSMVCFDDYIN